MCDLLQQLASSNSLNPPQAVKNNNDEDDYIIDVGNFPTDESSSPLQTAAEPCPDGHHLPDLVTCHQTGPGQVMQSSAAHLPDIVQGSGTRQKRIVRPATVGTESPKKPIAITIAGERRQRRSRFRIRDSENDAVLKDGLPPATVSNAAIERPLLWGRVGTDLAVIADSWPAGDRPQHVTYTTWTNRDRHVTDEDGGAEPVIGGNWEAVEAVSGLLLAVVVKALIYVCLTRLKKIVF